jgi:hypothetical protein
VNVGSDGIFRVATFESVVRVGFVTVTEPRRCRWCGRSFEVAAGPGRPREVCRRWGRPRADEARQKAAAHGLDESELIVTRTALESLRDRLYVLEAAVEDVDRDLAAAEGPDDVRRALDWLLDAARPLVAGGSDL